MQHILLDFGVPIALFLLMLISGTEITIKNLFVSKEHRGPLILAVAIQLIVVPLFALAILKIFSPDPRIASGFLLLTLCPGGGISNYYTYLAKRDVFLSASITSLGTLLSLLTIPAWLYSLQAHFPLDGVHISLPTVRIVSTLVFFIMIPLGVGWALKYNKPLIVSKTKTGLQIFSLFLIALILFLNTIYFYEEMTLLFFSILLHASTFILGSMFLAWTLTARMPYLSRPVLIIESAVRNVGIALIIGKTLFSPDMVGILTSFLIGYFVVEICVMLTYASFLRSQSVTIILKNKT